jgi:hypothetical protein
LGAVAFVSFPNCQQSGAEGLPPPSRTFLLFIFATLDGTISARNPAVDGVIPGPSPGTTLSHATIVADQVVAGATYTGLAIATNKEGQTFLYAADGGPNRAVDMFDGTLAFVKSFSDPKIPKNFTTYGIQAISGEIWVTFTPLNKAQSGFVDVFATDGTLLRHDAIHGPHECAQAAKAAFRQFAKDRREGG